MCIGERFQCENHRIPNPLHDITASGITKEWETVEPDIDRVVGPAVQANHFGLIAIDWQQAVPPHSRCKSSMLAGLRDYPTKLTEATYNFREAVIGLSLCAMRHFSHRRK